MEITFFERELRTFFKKNGRFDLPWRLGRVTPYSVWVSEIMLQQTQAKRAAEYYKKCMKRFADIHSLSRASWEDFLPYYRGLGYYQRGRNMLKTAKIIVEEYKGEFPKTKKELTALPGIGEYTANAILAFGFGEPVLAVDTNLQRVFGRFFYGRKDARIDTKVIEAKIKKVAQINSAVMDFANIVCKRNPLCETCPLATKCEYVRRGKRPEYVRLKRGTFPYKNASVFLFLHDAHKKYFSLDFDSYAPFHFSSIYNTRESIKRYFQKKYNIEVSVRPPRRRGYVGGKPTLFVNAQMLKGSHGFAEYRRSEAVEKIQLYEKKLHA